MRKTLTHLLFSLALSVSVFIIGIGTLQAADTGPKVRLATSMGDIVLQLYPEKAPKTVDNFLQYVRSGFYNGTIFHRVIPSFVIQGGGFTEELKNKPTLAPIKNEADNGLKNTLGTIAMARTRDPHSASSQFFINLKYNQSLDHHGKTQRGWGYCVFGKVIEGMEVVHEISKVPTGSAGPFRRDVPKLPIIIKEANLDGPPKKP